MLVVAESESGLGEGLGVWRGAKPTTSSEGSPVEGQGLLSLDREMFKI